MTCPLCGGAVVYHGLSSIECEGVGCENGPKALRGSWTQHKNEMTPATVWSHPVGARVIHHPYLGSCYHYFFPATWARTQVDQAPIPCDGSADTLEEAQRLALGAAQ